MAGLFALGKAAAQREYPQRYFLAQPTPPNAKRTATRMGAVVWRTRCVAGEGKDPSGIPPRLRLAASAKRLASWPP